VYVVEGLCQAGRMTLEKAVPIMRPISDVSTRNLLRHSRGSRPLSIADLANEAVYPVQRICQQLGLECGLFFFGGVWVRCSSLCQGLRTVLFLVGCSLGLCAVLFVFKGLGSVIAFAFERPSFFSGFGLDAHPFACCCRTTLQSVADVLLTHDEVC
jgi:hypothetical protein